MFECELKEADSFYSSSKFTSKPLPDLNAEFDTPESEIEVKIQHLKNEIKLKKEIHIGKGKQHNYIIKLQKKYKKQIKNKPFGGRGVTVPIEFIKGYKKSVENLKKELLQDKQRQIREKNGKNLNPKWSTLI